MRDVTSRYRRSSLGMWWAFIQPLVLMLLFTMLRGFVDIPSDGVPYLLFSYVGLVPWTFFTNAVSACGPSIIQNAEIIKKISMPKEVFPLAAVVATLFDLAMIRDRIGDSHDLLQSFDRSIHSVDSRPFPSDGWDSVRHRNPACRTWNIQEGFHLRNTFSDTGVAVYNACNLSLKAAYPKSGDQYTC